MDQIRADNAAGGLHSSASDSIGDATNLLRSSTSSIVNANSAAANIDGGEPDAPYRNHHYRLSVDIRSLSNLKRAANVSVQYAYPPISKQPVRSLPKWATANSELRIEGSSATMECYYTQHAFNEILAANPLKISIMSKNNLGNVHIGEVVVHLDNIHESKPVSFRCPMTGKHFKTRDEYDFHRKTMITLHSVGKIKFVPSKVPIIVRAVDESHTVNPLESSASAKMPTAATADGAKLRVFVAIEDLGEVSNEFAIAPNFQTANTDDAPSFKGIAVSSSIDNFNTNPNSNQGQSSSSSSYVPQDPFGRSDLNSDEKLRLDALRQDWEQWRKLAETHWKAALLEKETEIKINIEKEASAMLLDRTRELRKAQEETAKLEVRLRSTLEGVERQRSELILKEEQMSMKVAQKTAELQLLQKRVRDEAKLMVDSESRRADGLEKQIKSLQGAFDRVSTRCADTEKEFENYRALMRNTPETLLREDAARLRGQLNELRAEVEREKRQRAEMELEKEHYRSQMQRLALALKREREKSSVFARQDLEQLRLEFLAREERYVLDGDRSELNNIRLELARLKQQGINDISGNNDNSSSNSRNIYNNIGGSPISVTSRPPSHSSPSKTTSSNSNSRSDRIRAELQELLESGQYSSDADEPVIEELRRQLTLAERDAIEA